MKYYTKGVGFHTNLLYVIEKFRITYNIKTTCEELFGYFRDKYYYYKEGILKAISVTPEAKGAFADLGFIQVEISYFYSALVKTVDPNLWWLSLKEGDEVIIKDREGKSLEYPYCFSNDMATMSGHYFTIKRIVHDCYTGVGRERFFNFDTNKYLLYNDKLEYSWHSSMFVPIDSKPVNKLVITDCIIKF